MTIGKDRALVDIPIDDERVAAAIFDEPDGVVVGPDRVGRCAVDVGCGVEEMLAVSVDDPDVATGGTLVGHEASDDGEALAVRGPARDRDLEAVERTGDGDGIQDDAWIAS